MSLVTRLRALLTPLRQRMERWQRRRLQRWCLIERGKADRWQGAATGLQSDAYMRSLKK